MKRVENDSNREDPDFGSVTVAEPFIHVPVAWSTHSILLIRMTGRALEKHRAEKKTKELGELLQDLGFAHGMGKQHPFQPPQCYSHERC